MTYHDLVDAVKVKYESRIEAFLEKVRTFLTSAGYFCTGFDEQSHFDEYRWVFIFTKNNRQYDYILTIAESFAHGDEYAGVGFHIEVAEGDGNGDEICIFKPFNWTDKCWVDVADTQAVEERWKLIEDGYPLDDLLDNLTGAAHE